MMRLAGGHDDLRIVWPTRSRTGSQFVVEMTSDLLGRETLLPQSRLTGSRQETLEPEKKQGRFTLRHGLDYLQSNRIRSLKYEDPGNDDFALELLEAFPKAMFVASHRALDKVIRSHHNIPAWGHHESRVLYQFSAALPLYQTLHAARRLLLVDVDSPGAFRPDRFCAALGTASNEDFEARVGAWRPINDLRYQVEKTGPYDAEAVTDPPRLARLREIHPWIPELECGYQALCEATTQ